MVVVVGEYDGGDVVCDSFLGICQRVDIFENNGEVCLGCYFIVYVLFVVVLVIVFIGILGVFDLGVFDLLLSVDIQFC